MERVLGKIEGDYPGPLVICMAGVHGNEQVGIHAFRNVYSSIINHKIPIKGKLIGILGNMKAIRINRRYIDYDLNRAWTTDRINRVVENEIVNMAEDEEVKEIYEVIENESRGSYTEKVIADLHSTSADKGNFIVISEDEAVHPIIKALHIPTVIGLDNYLTGTLLSYWHQFGYLSFAFEGGMIGTNEVYQLHTSGLWEILDKSGCISHHDHEKEDHYLSHLQEVSEGLPKKVKVKYRKPVTKDDGFQMLPGFHNFQPVHQGQHLAFTNSGSIHAPMDGLLFMPLYQPEGEDGFFIVEELNGEAGK
jgi:succinylglutamate desuccinylase